MIQQAHCQSCGATDAESLDGADGYTACCNEPVMWGGSCTEIDCNHGDYGNYSVEYVNGRWVAVREEGR